MPKSDPRTDPLVSRIISLSERIFTEKLAPSCEHRREATECWRCDISGEACENSWKCPKLQREPSSRDGQDCIQEIGKEAV